MDGIINIEKSEAVDLLLAYHQWLRDWETLALAHPNQVATGTTELPDHLKHWWACGDNPHHLSWPQLLRLYRNPSEQCPDLPEDLVSFLRTSAGLPLPRSPSFGVPARDPPHMTGMTPKKIHETATMSKFVAHLFADVSVKPRIVDVGAGQGYLSRALASSPYHFQVLALDSNEHQTGGAIRRSNNANKTCKETGAQDESSREITSVSHKTVHIGDAASLRTVISSWIAGESTGNEIVPIIVVALHACGDLTPSILRFLTTCKVDPPQQWRVVGAVVVGCCYNMMGLSNTHLSSFATTMGHKHGLLELSTQHLHLATQAPLTWSDVSDSPPTALSIRKVSYRALLSRRLDPSARAETGSSGLREVSWAQKRVGRLASSAYRDFNYYLTLAAKRLQVGEALLDTKTPMQPDESNLQSKLETLYVLRCFMGPVIESYIVLDRLLYLQEHLQELNTQGSVYLYNLFDQRTGSLRNLALVWSPQMFS